MQSASVKSNALGEAEQSSDDHLDSDSRDTACDGAAEPATPQDGKQLLRYTFLALIARVDSLLKISRDKPKTWTSDSLCPTEPDVGSLARVRHRDKSLSTSKHDYFGNGPSTRARTGPSGYGVFSTQYRSKPAWPDRPIQPYFEDITPSLRSEGRGMEDESRSAMISQLERSASCPLLHRYSEYYVPDNQTTTESPESATDLDSNQYGAPLSRTQSPTPDLHGLVDEEHSTRASLMILIADVDDILQQTRDMLQVNSASAYSSPRRSPRFPVQGSSSDVPRSRGASRPLSAHPKCVTRARALTEPPQSALISRKRFRNALPAVNLSPEGPGQSSASAITQGDKPRSSRTSTSASQVHGAGKRQYFDDREDDDVRETPPRQKKRAETSVNYRFPCIFSAGEASKYVESAHSKKYEAISLLRYVWSCQPQRSPWLTRLDGICTVITILGSFAKNVSPYFQHKTSTSNTTISILARSLAHGDPAVVGVDLLTGGHHAIATA